MIIKLNEHAEGVCTSGILYAIANTPDPDPLSEDFWCWDYKYDIGYELASFSDLIPEADLFDSFVAAHDRAQDVLDAIYESEVYIVGLDPYTPHNPTGFVKKITGPNINENYCVYSSSSDGCYKEFTGTEDECNSWIENNKRRFPSFVNLKIQPESEPAKWSRDFDINESKSIRESYDPEDCYTVWEVKDTSTGKTKRIHSYDKDPEDFSTWLDDDEIINQYADEDTIITRFVYDNGLLDTSEVIWPEDLDESKSTKKDIPFNIKKEIEWLLDGIIDIGPDDKINDQDDWKRLYTTASRIKKQLNKEDAAGIFN